MSRGVGLYKHLFQLNSHSRAMELLAKTLIAITK